MRKTLLLAALAALVFLAGCNTMHGFGRDVQKVGSEIEEAAGQ
ncbi:MULTISPECIES: entericidin A/B family lipoprotein [Modicisalibacter]|nr:MULTISPECIES: entericidin A/B family lipoprotein [Halomonadaceae]MBZ9559186.1 entericidin A/B family lipoprotein [Modicisalibacter sp. R2A 31.J]MBZ9576649.1 entericidin A/B family lipoprotein [Modicisalibacter sp. MOD 31.J]